MMEGMISVGMVGGGKDSFMGKIHLEAIQRTGSVALVCGAFGSTRNSSYETGKWLGLPTRRVYGTYRDLFRRERSLPESEKANFVSIVTPNAMHYPISMSAMDTQTPILTEKPFTCNLDEAVNLIRKQQSLQVPYGIAMVYPHYPMLQKARGMIAAGEIGIIRKVTIKYELGWLSPRLETAGNPQANWRTDARRCGPAGCLADLGCHCFYLAEWLSGLHVSAVCGDLHPCVPGRLLDDDCTVLLRFENGIHGTLLMSQVTTGSAEGIVCEIIGDQATLVWRQSLPHQLELRAQNGTATNLQADQENLASPPSDENLPALFGDRAAYIQALAETYKAFASYVKGNKDAISGFMSPLEGLRSVAFVDAVLKNCILPQANEFSDEPPPPPPPKWQDLLIPEIQKL